MSGTRFLLSLGSNLGDRLAALRFGRAALAAEGVAVLACSSVYETEPVGGAVGQRPFYNACLLGRSALSPLALLGLLKRIEQRAGRRPGPRHSPRPLDLDLLLYGAQRCTTPPLTLPHPQLLARRFVLIPALEVDPALKTPDGVALGDALAALPPGREAVLYAHPPTALR